jgi:disulfide bond formation protein DsbB
MIAAYLSLLRSVTRHWPWWALAVSALMLAIAHAFETFGGLAPCLLCLKQREAYWIAMGVAAAAIVAGPFLKRPAIVRLLCGTLVVVFLAGMGVAIWHAGAEWSWWPGPKACALSTSATVSASGINDLLGGAPQRQPSCEVALWRFLGLSMAGWNVLISLKLAVLSGLAAVGFGDRK